MQVCEHERMSDKKPREASRACQCVQAPVQAHGCCVVAEAQAMRVELVGAVHSESFSATVALSRRWRRRQRGRTAACGRLKPESVPMNRQGTLARSAAPRCEKSSTRGCFANYSGSKSVLSAWERCHDADFLGQ